MLLWTLVSLLAGFVVSALNNATSASLNATKNSTLPFNKTNATSGDSSIPHTTRKARAQSHPFEVLRRESYAEKHGIEMNIPEVTRIGNKMFVNGQPFFIKGICYSPAPIGESPVAGEPFGDYFTAEYSRIWERDLPLMKAMGANVVRIYSWNVSHDHTPFLDAAHRYGLYVMVTYYMGTAEENPVNNSKQQQEVIQRFVTQVRIYRSHPAIIIWSFGNEINGIWNYYLEYLNDAFNCSWNKGIFPTDPDGCYFNPNGFAFNYTSGKPSTTQVGACRAATHCLYRHFYHWIDEAARQSKRALGKYKKLIISSFADVDYMDLRIGQFERYAPHIDGWGAQIYRGYTFGSNGTDFLANLGSNSTKVQLITEFGVDAYKDSCGWSGEKICWNSYENPGPGEGEDQLTQAAWIKNLATLLMNSSSVDGRGSTAGGFVMAWMDEYWKGSVNSKGCYPPWPSKKFKLAHCQEKGHAQCPIQTLLKPNICGYSLGSAFDHYVNEGWWGIMAVQRKKSWFEPTYPKVRIDKLRPRQAYVTLQQLWLTPKPESNDWVLPLISTLGAGAATMIVALVAFIKRKLSSGGSAGGGYTPIPSSTALKEEASINQEQ
eukprot:gb/GEZN01003199.1/.p1 GENE.gb/GEZN01003199.1/~~gb/GEZN01003199.1/.p1  ORF type:complete len:603 (+),score=93.37 gb/GEZN01003199.1/:131-1939(+)